MESYPSWHHHPVFEKGGGSMQTAVLDGVSLEYEVRGCGDPIALIHCGLFAENYLPLMNHPALASHRLVRYRRRGYGANSKPAGRVTIADLTDLLRYLGIQRAHVAGHSWGGLVALQLAADHPDLVGSLVLMEAALRVRSGGPASQDLSRLMAPAFQRYREGDLEAAAEAFLAATLGPDFRQVLDRIMPSGWWKDVVRDWW
jgi:pimeloyl-ACP methyl ester carboxylesterase